MTLTEVVGSEDLERAQALFEEYARSLGIDLDFQGFAQELASLPGRYVRPDGVLILARSESRAVGCVAVRRFDADRCEMKRLYVRDEARGCGLGRRLAEAAVSFGRSAGYRAMLLDTLPTMTTAQAMYRQIGFRDVPPYRFNPIDGTVFLQLDLDTNSG